MRAKGLAALRVRSQRRRRRRPNSSGSGGAGREGALFTLRLTMSKHWPRGSTPKKAKRSAHEGGKWQREGGSRERMFEAMLAFFASPWQFSVPPSTFAVDMLTCVAIC